MCLCSINDSLMHTYIEHVHDGGVHPRLNSSLLDPHQIGRTGEIVAQRESVITWIFYLCQLNLSITVP